MHMNRCLWVNEKNEKYIKYHDEEWCEPKHNDKELYELLILESFQAGLSWECDSSKINELLNNKDIIRNKLKVNASITNSKVFKDIVKEYGSFNNYIWSFTNNKVLYLDYEIIKNDLSDKISKDLIKRGMKFVGTTIIYSYLQAIGIINSHHKNCFKYKEDIWKKD